MPSSVPEEPVQILPYDPGWVDVFLREKALLQQALAPWLAGDIEHVGSTAVAGLAAKPVVDIMAPVRSLDESRGAIEAAATLGYLHYPYKATEMHWFCKPSPAQRTHHLHIVPIGSPLWNERIAFRNALRSNPVLAGDYARLKRQLAKQYRDDREAYTEAKTPFIRAALQTAGIARPSAV